MSGAAETMRAAPDGAGRPRDVREALRSLSAHAPDWRALAPSRVLADAAGARRSAVLMLFGPAVPEAVGDAAGPVEQAQTDVLLLERPRSLRHHPGQIGFPGGGLEPGDADLPAAALREAVEETGLDPTGVEMFAPLPAAPLPVSDNLVTPVPAWWRHPSPVRAVDAGETASVFRVPVTELLDPANRAVVTRAGAHVVPPLPAFQVGGRLVWGFTAILLSGTFDALGWTIPWDRSRRVAATL